VLESVGAPYLDLYGSPLPVTPGLCRLRDKGIVFENFYATANHSIASALPLFGSTYNDVRTTATVLEHPRFPIPAASTWLKGHGYRTYFLGAGGKRSWEYFRNMTPAFISAGQFDVARDVRHPFWAACPDAGRFLADDYLDRAVFADARRVLRAARGEKFFLMVWNYGTHYPYRDGVAETFDERHFPPAVRHDPARREGFAAYLRSVRRADACIAEFYTELERLGLADDTLVVVTADHGEAWGQHGFTFHGSSLYEEEVRVPLLLLCPRLARLGPRRRVVGSHIDLWPTVADGCGLPADPRWQGRSLLGGDPRESRRAFFYRAGGLLGVREGKYTLLWDVRGGRRRLFDVEADPGERTNVARGHPDLCVRLQQRLRDWANFQARLTRDRLAAGNR
jgi:arylsulfatase A-like enzyme